jgi:hypothetical protein
MAREAVAKARLVGQAEAERATSVQPSVSQAVASGAAAAAANPAGGAAATTRATDTHSTPVTPPPAPPPRPRPAPVPSQRETAKTTRNLLLRLDQPDLERTQRVTLSFRLEDGEQRLVQEVRNVQLDLNRAEQSDDLQLQLNIRLHPKS